MPSPAQLPELASGHKLDRYELICPVAQGGMASVWLARQRGMHGFEKMVALKTILPSLAADSRFRRMLLDEARIASRIEHVNVAQTLDLGEQDGHLYLVLEWVDGDSLSKLDRALEKASLSLPLPILLRVMVEACAGLHAAHELCDEHGTRVGVVHRDVSPQNILVSAKGHTKLIDFGIAKAQSGPSEETRAGILKGKIHYMPPEQALRQRVDERTDVWAIGAVLYRMLTRRTPYESASPIESLQQIMALQPAAPLPPDVDRDLAVLVHAALSPSPSERPQSALALQNELERLAPQLGGVASNQELSAFVTTHLGATLQERRDKISRALRAVNDGETLAQPPASGTDSQSSLQVTRPDLPHHERPLDPDTGAAMPSVNSSALTLQMPSKAPEAPSGHRFAAAAGITLLIASAAWLISARASGPTAAARPHSASAASAAKASAQRREPAVPLAPEPAPAKTSESLPEPIPVSDVLPAPVLPSALPLSKPAPVKAPRSKPAPVKKAATTPKVVSKRKVVDDGF